MCHTVLTTLGVRVWHDHYQCEDGGLFLRIYTGNYAGDASQKSLKYATSRGTELSSGQLSHSVYPSG